MTFDPSPLGNSVEDAAAFVRAEIERSLPPGWAMTGLDRDSPLRGKLTPIGETEFTAPCYGVRISGGFDLLIFTWGNTDYGPLRAETATDTALVIEPLFLRMFGMAACLGRLFDEFPPNSYGLT